MAALLYVALVTCAMLAPLQARTTIDRDIAEILERLQRLPNYKSGDYPSMLPGPTPEDKEDYPSMLPGPTPEDKEGNSGATHPDLSSLLDITPHHQPDLASLYDQGHSLGKKADTDDTRHGNAVDLESLMKATKKGSKRLDFSYLLREPLAVSHTEKAQARQANRDAGAFNINICTFCDSKCMAEIATVHDSADDYWSAVYEQVQTRLNTLDGSFLANPWMNLYWPGDIQAASYVANGQARGVELLGGIADIFWGEGSPSLIDAAQGASCHIGFFAIADDDLVWDYCEGVEGVANMMQLCTGLSYSAGKLKLNIQQMADLLAHELGHLMGMYHDGAVNSGMDGLRSYAMSNAVLSAPYLKMEEQCTASDHHCPAGQNSCVMREGGSNVAAYSGCSNAYFQFWIALGVEFPMFYTHSCITP